MYYGEEKVRQMARSLLPSQSRKGARARKRLAKKAHKAKNRQITKDLVRSDAAEDTLVFSDDRHDVRYVVQDRRNADKVGPFIHWITEKTKDMRQEDRKSYARSVLPDSVIGHHALTHLPREGFDHPNVDYVRSLPKVPRYMYKKGPDGKYHRVRWVEEKGWTREELYAFVRNAIERGYHGDLNRAIDHQTERVCTNPRSALASAWFPVYAPIGPTNARRCHGLHDVKAFVNDVLKARGGRVDKGMHHPEWYSSLVSFLKAHRAALG